MESYVEDVVLRWVPVGNGQHVLESVARRQASRLPANCNRTSDGGEVLALVQESRELSAAVAEGKASVALVDRGCAARGLFDVSKVCDNIM